LALYAGGMFYERVIRWNGVAWSAMQNDANGSVDALCVHDDGSGPRLYAGGRFTQMGGSGAEFIAALERRRLVRCRWRLMNNWVHTLASFPARNELFAGGRFTRAGQADTIGIARWSGQQWLAAGEGLANHGGCLTVFNDGSGQASTPAASSTTRAPSYRPGVWRGGMALHGTRRSAASTGTCRHSHPPPQGRLLCSSAVSSLRWRAPHRWLPLPSPFIAELVGCVCYANCDLSTATPVLNVNRLHLLPRSLRRRRPLRQLRRQHNATNPQRQRLPLLYQSLRNRVSLGIAFSLLRQTNSLGVRIDRR
jgi:hypothetical protein